MPQRNLDDVIGRHFAADKLMLLRFAEQRGRSDVTSSISAHSGPSNGILFGEQT